MSLFIVSTELLQNLSIIIFTKLTSSYCLFHKMVLDAAQMTLYNCLMKRILKFAITFVQNLLLIHSQRGLSQYRFQISFSLSHFFRIRNFI